MDYKSIYLSSKGLDINKIPRMRTLDTFSFGQTNFPSNGLIVVPFKFSNCKGEVMYREAEVHFLGFESGGHIALKNLNSNMGESFKLKNPQNLVYSPKENKSYNITEEEVSKNEEYRSLQEQDITKFDDYTEDNKLVICDKAKYGEEKELKKMMKSYATVRKSDIEIQRGKNGGKIKKPRLKLLKKTYLTLRMMK